MCCENFKFGNEKDRHLNLECNECGGPVDRDGDTLEDNCGYSPVVCKTCGWRPCDQSC